MKRKKVLSTIDESLSDIEKLIIPSIELNNLNDKQLSVFYDSKYKNWIKI